jgi:hypothetical protein
VGAHGDGARLQNWRVEGVYTVGSWVVTAYPFTLDFTLGWRNFRRMHFTIFFINGHLVNKL